MSLRRSLGVIVLLPTMALGYLACGESTDEPGVPDSSTGGIDSGGADGSTSQDATSAADTSIADTSLPDTSVADVTADAIADASVDAITDASAPDAAAGTTCQILHQANPGLTSGVYSLDPDGNGPLQGISAYCDMTFDGGGWTMIQAYTGTQTPVSLSGAMDGGILTAAPRPGVFGAFSGPVVQALANLSAQVHIRTSFQPDAGSDGGVWITSRVPDAGPTMPIVNLRNLVVLSNGTDGGFGDWTGPQANATKLSWTPDLYGCSALVAAESYPSIYWGCGNYESLNILVTQSGHCRWRWNDGQSVMDPIEVYVR